MVNNLLFLSVPDCLKNETDSRIDENFVLYNASEFQTFSTTKLVLPLVLVFLQCVVLAIICFKNLEEEKMDRHEESVQQKMLDASLLSGLNLLEVGLNYGTFSNDETDSSPSSTP